MAEKISTILAQIDSGRLALPKFQRGYVWNGDDVRKLMDSLYRHHPIGSLLVWATEGEVEHRGDQNLASGEIQLLLDGQQRITSLYGIIRGKPPNFFDGDKKAFTGLHFNLESETFAFYKQSEMKNNPLWLDLSRLMIEGSDGPMVKSISNDHINKLLRLFSIHNDREIHVDTLTGNDMNIDTVVEIFNKVNSGGRTLSDGELALAKIGASWPDAREEMQSILRRWAMNGYDKFTLDWLLRNVNAVLTGEARFFHLHNQTKASIKKSLKRTERSIDHALNLIADRLGLEYGGVLAVNNAIPIMARYIDRKGGMLTTKIEQDRLLYWYFQSAIWGRFSGSIETTLNQDLLAIDDLDNAIENLIEKLRLSRGNLRIEAAHFGGVQRNARFYPVLYALTRVGEAKDLGIGIPLKRNLSGNMNALEVHHIFPKALLKDNGYTKMDWNAIANFCFLTKATNLKIGKQEPAKYFPEVERNHPGALASQWIPEDPNLWKVEKYHEFLEARRNLLADAANKFLDDLLHGMVVESIKVDMVPVVSGETHPRDSSVMDAGILDEEAVMEDLNKWVKDHGLPGGMEHEIAHPTTGEQLAVFDIAWPDGLRDGYNEPVTLLLDADASLLHIANEHRFRYFTSVAAFKRYVEQEVLVLDDETEEETASG